MSATEILPASRSLDELADFIATTQGEIVERYRGLLDRAVALGEALIEARQVAVEPGSWKAFLGRTGFSSVAASNYMRLAAYRDEIPSDATSIQRGLVAIAGKPNPYAVTNRAYGDEVRAAIKELHDGGMRHGMIANTVGVAPSFVSDVLHPERKAAAKARYRENAKAKRAAESAAAEATLRKRADTLARGDGGALGKAYSLTRQACQQADAAREAAAGDQREALAVAYRALGQADQALVRALGAE